MRTTRIRVSYSEQGNSFPEAIVADLKFQIQDHRRIVVNVPNIASVSLQDPFELVARQCACLNPFVVKCIRYEGSQKLMKECLGSLS